MNYSFYFIKWFMKLLMLVKLLRIANIMKGCQGFILMQILAKTCPKFSFLILFSFSFLTINYIVNLFKTRDNRIFTKITYCCYFNRSLLSDAKFLSMCL